MQQETRGNGTMIVAPIGLLGAIVAGLIAETFDWRQTYFIGGGMGIALLALRIGVAESGMYSALKEEKINKGNFFILFKNKKNTLKYLFRMHGSIQRFVEKGSASLRKHQAQDVVAQSDMLSYMKAERSLFFY